VRQIVGGQQVTLSDLAFDLQRALQLHEHPPAALRLGLGVRTCLGDVIKPLANKALLIHCAHDHHGKRDEHGWGCIPHNLDELIICPDGTARILYQGELRPGKYVRAQIPVPAEGMTGMVTIRATFCYTTRTDPEDPGNYTRSGLVVVFRPHDGDRKPRGRTPAARSIASSASTRWLTRIFSVKVNGRPSRLRPSSARAASLP